MGNPASGGSYVRQKDGSLTRVENPPDEHPAGNAPRGADGTMIGVDTPVSVPAQPAYGAPAPPRGWSSVHTDPTEQEG